MIDSITIENFMCFRGKHELVLGPGVYAVIAEHELDAERSNWCGKTTLLRTLGPFLLFGDHGKRLEDDWITNGEDFGSVTGKVDGFTITRSRRRGASTKLKVEHGDRALEGAAAQQLIETELVPEADFYGWFLTAQKRMSEFIDADPGVRQKTVIEWLQLEPLMKAGKRAEREFTAKLLDLEQKRSRVQVARSNRNALLDRYKIGLELDHLEARAALHALVETAEAKHVEAVAKHSVEQAKLAYAEKDAVRVQAEEAAAKKWEYEHAKRNISVTELAECKAEQAQLTGQSGTVHAAVHRAGAVAARDVSEKEVARLKKLVVGEFDGKCPVSPGFACPATEQITQRRAENKKALEKEEQTLKEKKAELATAEKSFDAAAIREARVDELGKRIAAIEELLKTPEPEQPKVWHAVDVTPVAAFETDRLASIVREQEKVLGEIRTRFKDYDTFQAALEKAELEADQAAGPVATWRAATMLLKTAVRRVAESSLLRIEARANESLRGIDLRVSTSWARPTKNLADTCGACGAAFPKTRTIKTCDRCGEQRGPKLEERLDLELSDRSGAAEDLAGWAYKFAAGAFTRRRRTCRWDTALVDEPFGSLDPVHARALARYILSSLLEEHAMRQVFVVAHTRGIMVGMPRRIVITATSTGSKARVE